MEELSANTISNRKSLELKESRNGKLVPVLNGIYLHSIYNPEKEAQAFASNYIQSIKEKSRILVLGLGFGYHVNAIAELASATHKEYEITVYEPNEEIIKAFEEQGGFQNENIKIIHAQRATEVFDRKDFVLFLAAKPAIIRHEASYNLNKDFYREFLTFKASKKMDSYARLLSEKGKGLFPTKEGSLDQALASIKKAGRLGSKSDYAFLLMEAVIKSSEKARGLQSIQSQQSQAARKPLEGK